MNNGAIVGAFYNCTGATLFQPSVQQCVVGYTCTPATTSTTTASTTTASTTTASTTTASTTTTSTTAPTTERYS